MSHPNFRHDHGEDYFRTLSVERFEIVDTRTHYSSIGRHHLEWQVGSPAVPRCLESRCFGHLWTHMECEGRLPNDAA